MDDSLSFESFYEGAKKAAHRAMEDHGREEYDEFALHAGVAVERLAKAVLVSKNPIYIIEIRGNVTTDMLFHMGGHRTAKKVRTIGASEAVTRLRTLEVLAPDKELDALIDLRNGVAHTGSGDEAKAFLPTLAQTVETLLTDLGGPLDAFWGRWTTAARMAVDDKRSEVYRDVQVRIRQAKHRYDDRFSDLPEHLQKRLKREESLLCGSNGEPYRDRQQREVPRLRKHSPRSLSEPGHAGDSGLRGYRLALLHVSPSARHARRACGGWHRCQTYRRASRT